MKYEMGSAVAVPTHITAASSEKIPTGIEMEANHENDNEEENHNRA